MITEKFFDYLKYEKRYADKTLTAYKTDLLQFQNFLNNQYEVTEWKEVTHYYVRSFIVHLIEQKMNFRSINRKISTLKSFYNFSLKKGWLEKNPMLKIISPKTKKSLPVYLDIKSMGHLLNHDYFEQNFNGQRDRIMIELFYSTGVRCAELIHLKMADVDLPRQTIRILGKGNKERIIPFSSDLALLLQQYILFRNNLTPKLDDNFLLTEKGRLLNQSLVYRKVKYYLSLISTQEKKSPHVLRHTFATHLTNEGAELNAVKELLGHSSLAATQVYTHNNIKKLKEIYKLSHPKS